MKKSFLFLLLLICILLPTYSQIQISQDSAFGILKSDILGVSWQSMEIYTLKNPIDANSVINTQDSCVISPDSKSWFFFVDIEPTSEWWHPCKYVFINTTDGSILEVDTQTPPKLDSLLNLNRILPMNKSIDSTTFYSISRNISPSNTNTDDYVVIISGGWNRMNNWPRYWNHCASIYQVLVSRYGYNRDHIFVIMSDGIDTTPDYNNGSFDNPVFASYPLDLDGDGIDDVQYSATKANISSVFNQLRQKVNSKSNVSIFVTDHGGVGSTIALWNEVKMSKNEFQIEINKINHSKSINLCMVQCYGGGYTTALAGKNRIITTACSSMETAKAMPPYYKYSEFCYHWIAAANGTTPDGTPVNADYNNDGFVSMEEAFQYASTHDTQTETPQYYSNKSCLGASMDLSGVFDHSCFGIDLYTRDNISDNGSEPLNDPLLGLTDSPDLWVRNQQDSGTTHQSMTTGTNYLYARIHNRGTDTSYSCDSLRIFAKPTFLNWHNWNTNSWSELCVASLPRIAPNHDTIICIPISAQGLLNSNYAFYSRIESPFDPLTNAETISVGRNVEDNNNISLKNVVVANATITPNNYGLDANFVASPNSNNSSNLRLNLSNNSLNLCNVVEVTIVFSEDLMTTWTPSFSGLKQLTDNTFVATSETIELYNLPETEITLRYNFLTKQNATEDMYKTYISQYIENADNEEVIGSLTIQTEKPTRTDFFRANAGNDTAILINSTATLHASQINEDATYRWYDKNRNFKYEGLNYSVTPTETSEYILEVTAKSDGYRDLDTVKVTVVPGCIRSITPNPVVDNYVSVSYEYASSVNSAYLYIYNTGTTTLAGTYNLSNLDNVSSMDIDVTNFPTGSYIVSLVCDGVICQSKVLLRQ